MVILALPAPAAAIAAAAHGCRTADHRVYHLAQILTPVPAVDLHPSTIAINHAAVNQYKTVPVIRILPRYTIRMTAVTAVAEFRVTADAPHRG